MNSKKSPDKTNKSPRGSSILPAIIVALFIGLIVFGLSVAFGINKPHLWVMHQQYVLIEMILSSANIVLLVYLLSNYIAVYFATKTRFTLGLIVVAAGLLAHSITANPIFFTNLGYIPMSGPFMFIPSIFTLIAILALTYIARE